MAVLATVAIQITFGVNLVSAMQCEKEIEQAWFENPNTVKSRFEMLGWRSINEFTLEETKGEYYGKLNSINKPNQHNGNKYDWDINGNYKSCKDFAQSWLDGRTTTVELMRREKRYGEICAVKYMADNDCRNLEVFKYKKGSGQQSDSNNSSLNQSDSSSSSQSNKKANRQTANNQSSSSNLSEQTIKKINKAVDQTNIAHNNKDYAKSIAALNIILAYSKNITVVATASTRLAGYYKNGYGVSKDEVKAQALFEQASMRGDADADTHICENYENGTGGVTKNHQTAIKYCTAAANKGNVSAMGKLGYLYHAGIGTNNPELGNEWLCKAAKQGESTAIRNAEKLKLNCS